MTDSHESDIWTTNILAYLWLSGKSWAPQTLTFSFCTLFNCLQLSMLSLPAAYTHLGQRQLLHFIMSQTFCETKSSLLFLSFSVTCKEKCSEGRSFSVVLVPYKVLNVLWWSFDVSNSGSGRNDSWSKISAGKRIGWRIEQNGQMSLWHFFIWNA